MFGRDGFLFGKMPNFFFSAVFTVNRISRLLPRNPNNRITRLMIRIVRLIMEPIRLLLRPRIRIIAAVRI